MTNMHKSGRISVRGTALLLSALCALGSVCVMPGCGGAGETPGTGTEAPTTADSRPAEETNAETAADTTDDTTPDTAADTGTETTGEPTETPPETQPVTEAETTPVFDPVPPDFTADDMAAHKEIPLFNDMDVPFYDEKVGLLPTIAPYLVPDSPACVLILPGGGYFQRTDGAEGIEIAEAYNAAGISAFVVRYRYDAQGTNGNVTYDRHAIMADAQRSVQFVRYYADEFGIDPHKVAVCGFSAGGHLAMVISEHADELYEGAESSAVGQCDSHPDALVLGYPLVNMKNAYWTVPIIFLNEEKKDPEALAKYSYTYRLEALPPTFMFAYRNDDTVAVRLNEQPMAKAMEEAGMTVECYLFKDGAHGIGLGRNYPDYGRWHDLSVTFLRNLFGV